MAHITSTSVSSAVLNNDIKKLSSLIKQGKRIDIQDNLGYTPLHVAAKKLHTGCVDILLQHPECPINEQNFEGCTSLYLACENKSPSLKLITNLLEHKADPNICNNELVRPLHLACKNGNVELVKLLLGYNADINIIDLDKYTPLHYAVDKNKKQIVEFLLEAKADTRKQDVYGLNPLMLSIVRKHDEIFDLLLPFTENLDTSGKANETALSLAINTSNIKIVEKLVQNRVNMNSALVPLAMRQLLCNENNFDVFKYIWGQIDLKIVSLNTDFLSILEELTVQNNLSTLKHILQTENLKLGEVNENKDLFSKVFSLNPLENLDEKYFENNKENFKVIIEGLHKQGAHVKHKFVTEFIKFIKNCSYALELLQMFLENFIFDIDEYIVLYTFNVRVDLALFLLQNSSNTLDSTTLYDKLAEGGLLKNVDYIVKYFSPTDEFIYQLLFLLDDERDHLHVNLLENLFRKVKSLTEISRDAVRSNVCKLVGNNPKNRELFLSTIKNYPCTNITKEILLFKRPVNNIDVSDLYKL